MSNVYQVIVEHLCEQGQTLPAPPTKNSDYEAWAHDISKYTKFFRACRSFCLAVEDNKLNKAASSPACCGKTISYVLHVKNFKLFNFGDKFIHMVICMVVKEIATESIKSKREMIIIWEIS